VEGTGTQRRWIQRATVYALAMTVAGGAIGVAFAAAGWGLSNAWSDATVVLAVALGAVTLVYALHELGFLRLPVPGRDWQVPATWVRHGFYRSAVVFGGIVGFGVFTRAPYASLPVLLAWLFVAGDPAYGLLAGLVYGGTRALSIYLSAPADEANDLVSLNQRLMSLIPRLHQITGVALAVFAAYLLLAPNLP
jgi:hypothetical protein